MIEPTVSGKHDMGEVARLTAHFNLPSMVCVNKFDHNHDQTSPIEKFAKGFLKILFAFAGIPCSLLRGASLNIRPDAC